MLIRMAFVRLEKTGHQTMSPEIADYLWIFDSVAAALNSILGPDGAWKSCTTI